MRRFIIALVSLVLGSSAFVQAQSFVTLDLGYSSNNYFGFGASFWGEYSPIVFGFSGGVNTDTSACGKDYTGIIGFNTHPEDHQSKDTSTDMVYAVSLGHRLVSNAHTYGGLYISALGGLGERDTYLNCYDRHHILSSSGWYYITLHRDVVFEYGGKLSYWRGEVFGFEVGYSNIRGVFFNLSLSLGGIF